MKNKWVALLVLLWINTAISANNNQFDDFFNALESLSADFNQTTYSDTRVLLNNASGRFSFKRPQQLRWHTTKPNEQILLLNNNEFWLIDVELEQASLQVNQDLSQTPLYWLINKPESLTHTPKLSHRKDGIDWYQTNNPSTQHQQLLFGFKNKKLHAISLKNALEQIILIVFDKIVINAEIKPKTFMLKLGPDFDIIR